MVPSKIAGDPGRAVSRVQLKIESATGDDGRALNRALFTTPFQWGPELVELWKAGDRVRLTTTTPSGLHIAHIESAAVQAGN